MKRLPLLLIILAILAVAYVLARSQSGAPRKEYAAWTDFMRDVRDGKIGKIVVKGRSYSGDFRDGVVPSAPDGQHYMIFRLEGPAWSDVSPEDKQTIATNVHDVRPEP